MPATNAGPRLRPLGRAARGRAAHKAPPRRLDAGVRVREAGPAELTLASRPRASDFGMGPPLPRPRGLGHGGDEGLAKGARPRIGRRQRAFEAELRKVYFAMRLFVAQSVGCSCPFRP